jgi:hypothetical protein
MPLSKARAMGAALISLMSPIMLSAPICVQAQVVSRPVQVAPPSSLPQVPPPSGAGAVDKLLRPGPSDPEVPLPKADLATPSATERGANRPEVFGRREQGGGVLGLKIPFPAGSR